MKNSSDRKNGLITIISITIVNILNYGLNLILGRWLGPEGFAEANVIATLVLVISFLGIAVQLMVANEIARAKEEDRRGILKWLEKKTIQVALIIMLILLGVSPIISSFLQLESVVSIVLIAFALPFYFILSARRGYFQGNQEFKSFSMTYILETFGRLLSTLLLLYIANAFAYDLNTEFIALGFLISFVVGSLYTVKKITRHSTREQVKIDKRGLVLFIAIITLYELSQILINNFDVILTKHFFDNYEAGLYSSIALVGRIVFFGTWTIVTLLFPKVIEKEKNGEPHHHLFYGALGIVMLGGLSITFGCAFFDDFIIDLLFGGAYAESTHLLWKYALATSLFATANVFSYYYMGLKNYLPVFISLLIGLLQIYLIYKFHSSLVQVVSIQIISMSILLAMMLSFHFLKTFVVKKRTIAVIKTAY